MSQRFNEENEDIRHSPKNSVDNFAEKDYNYFTESEEFYKLFPTEAARGTFRRSLANKTNGMRDGETKNIYVVGYIFEATGYLQGEIIAEYSNKTKHLLEVNRSDYNTIGEDKETVALWVENVRDADRRSGSDSDLSNGGRPSSDDRLLASQSKRNSSRDNERIREAFETKEEVERIVKQLKELYGISDDEILKYVGDEYSYEKWSRKTVDPITSREELAKALSKVARRD